jgi:hypothetical protein
MWLNGVRLGVRSLARSQAGPRDSLSAGFLVPSKCSILKSHAENISAQRACLRESTLIVWEYFSGVPPLLHRGYICQQFTVVRVVLCSAGCTFASSIVLVEADQNR